MGIEFIIKKLSRLKYIIILSLVLALGLGCLLGYIFNKPVYRSVADVYIYRISLNIQKSFDENYYYLFYKYFKDINVFDTEITVNYFNNESVHKSAYEKTIKAGYEISYKDFKAGISKYDRDSDNSHRVTVVYSDKGLTEFVLSSILEESEKKFNSDITNRIRAEISDRTMKEKNIEASIVEKTIESNLKREEVDSSIQDEEKGRLTAELLILEEELDTLLDLFNDNHSHTLRMEQVADFPFWELYRKNIEIVETGEAVSRNIWSIGATAVVLVLLLWIVGLYISHTVYRMKR